VLPVDSIHLIGIDVNKISLSAEVPTHTILH